MKKYYEIPLQTLVCRSLNGQVGQPFTLEQQSLSLDPQLTPRDEATLLLTVGAEVEHALMVQYLYGAYSVRYDFENNELNGRLRGLYRIIAQIAREEMGHLMTVQNLLQLIGSPLSFEREDSPFESELYPFRFKLESLSQQSLAKYITAERPAVKPPHMSDEKWRKIEEISAIAQCANDGHPVKHVGPIYERLIQLFEHELEDGDFLLNRADSQGTWRDWGYDEGLSRDDSQKVHVDSFEGSNPDTLRKTAVEALHRIGEQGEGYGDMIDSHFERFLALYEQFLDLEAELEPQGIEFIWPVATNPSTSKKNIPQDDRFDLVTSAKLAFEERGYISNDRARNWGHLFNLRYRLLLAYLMHFLRSEGSRYLTQGPDKGDRTPRGLLLLWSFDEMRHIKKIAEKMVRLPLHPSEDGMNAGPPFQLPYTLTISDREPFRWRSHLDVVKASLTIINDLGSTDAGDPFLEDLQTSDERQIKLLEILSCGETIPPDFFPQKFQKVATILEEAVRGFTIDAHTNFWTNINRDQFVHLHMFNTPFLAKNPHNECQFVANNSQLVSRLDSNSKTGRMPRYRPNIDSSRQEFVSEWIDDQAPDNQPPGQIGVVSERSPNLDVETGIQTAFAISKSDLSYQADIRPLFREFDYETLQRFDNIDLSDIENVRENIHTLQDRIQAGKLPYDACWPSKKIALFRRWVDEGMKS
ncbi:MAG: ferritin-like domain-containing protein [Crocosphaera sp.]|nr:ferritin-like domain-containing protein [Crocosphaera sp.]